MNTQICLGNKLLRRERNSRWIEMKGRQKWRMMAAGILLALAGAIGTINAQEATTPRAAPNAALVQQDAKCIVAKAIFIVRHAEYKGKPEEKNLKTELTDCGTNRAKELCHFLTNAGITHIITSTSLRTKTTASFIAHQAHIKPDCKVIHEGRNPDPAPAPWRNQAIQIRDYILTNANPTNVFLIVYHHSVFPDILDTLGCDTNNLAFKIMPKEEEFDRIYCVIPEAPPKNSRLILLRYGKPFKETN